ncbi:MAG TPA: hypothetical protein VFS43_23365 [Polyangiaceae bacterium]|nr:hypothetical protein [Polyangiaceae bacterium]
MADSRVPSDLLLRFDAPDGRRAVVLEDDGRVAYAYLLQEESVVGDVWLYNVAEAPTAVDWKDRSAMPFLNPKKFCAQANVPRLSETSKVECRWRESGVDVSVNGLLIARIDRGSKPGWSRGAGLAGPLAKPLAD